jgi:hypothetical protein
LQAENTVFIQFNSDVTTAFIKEAFRNHHETRQGNEYPSSLVEDGDDSFDIYFSNIFPGNPRRITCGSGITPSQFFQFASIVIALFFLMQIPMGAILFLFEVEGTTSKCVGLTDGTTVNGCNYFNAFFFLVKHTSRNKE